MQACFYRTFPWKSLVQPTKCVSKLCTKLVLLQKENQSGNFCTMKLSRNFKIPLDDIFKIKIYTNICNIYVH